MENKKGKIKMENSPATPQKDSLMSLSLILNMITTVSVDKIHS